MSFETLEFWFATLQCHLCPPQMTLPGSKSKFAGLRWKKCPQNEHYCYILVIYTRKRYFSYVWTLVLTCCKAQYRVPKSHLHLCSHSWFHPTEKNSIDGIHWPISRMIITMNNFKSENLVHDKKHMNNKDFQTTNYLQII